MYLSRYLLMTSQRSLQVDGVTSLDDASLSSLKRETCALKTWPQSTIFTPSVSVKNIAISSPMAKMAKLFSFSKEKYGKPSFFLAQETFSPTRFYCPN